MSLSALADIINGEVCVIEPIRAKRTPEWTPKDILVRLSAVTIGLIVGFLAYVITQFLYGQPDEWTAVVSGLFTCAVIILVNNRFRDKRLETHYKHEQQHIRDLETRNSSDPNTADSWRPRRFLNWTPGEQVKAILRAFIVASIPAIGLVVGSKYILGFYHYFVTAGLVFVWVFYFSIISSISSRANREIQQHTDISDDHKYYEEHGEWPD
jgi:hypothetical protein